jgi:hypothetical protein
MLYTAGSQSLAVLEALVQDQPLRARYLMIPAIQPKNLKIERVSPEGLPVNWRSLAALIIFKIGTLYSPLKLFLPVSLVLFALATGIYGYTYTTGGRFTNMSALLYTTSLLTFLIGLVSEQITNLMYQMKGR